MTRRSLVIITALAGVVLFAGSTYFYQRTNGEGRARLAASKSTSLVRPHSPVIGPPTALVTIVEFFDPSCESCRAFHPVVKQIMAEYPKSVRLVLRYAPFHEGSDEAVKILEVARLQNVFVPVLKSLLATQPNWAAHGAPNLRIAWQAARTAGLNLERGQSDANRPEIAEVLRQDAADIRSLNVKQTPTFFVNGKSLQSFGRRQLADLVRSEVEAISRK